jgi:hypothetical protein
VVEERGRARGVSQHRLDDESPAPDARPEPVRTPRPPTPVPPQEPLPPLEPSDVALRARQMAWFRERRRFEDRAAAPPAEPAAEG